VLGDFDGRGGAAVGRGTLRGVRAAIRHPELCGELEMKVQGPKVGADHPLGPEQGWEKIEAWCRKLRED